VIKLGIKTEIATVKIAEEIKVTLIKIIIKKMCFKVAS